MLIREAARSLPVLPCLMGVCAAGSTASSATSTYHMLINAKIRRNVPGTSVVLGITGLAAFRKCCGSQSGMRGQHQLTSHKQAGVSPG